MVSTGAAYCQPLTNPPGSSAAAHRRKSGISSDQPGGSAGWRQASVPRTIATPVPGCAGQVAQRLQARAGPRGHPSALLDQVRPPDRPGHRRGRLERQPRGPDRDRKPGLGQADRGGQAAHPGPDHQDVGPAAAHRGTVSGGSALLLEAKAERVAGRVGQHPPALAARLVIRLGRSGVQAGRLGLVQVGDVEVEVELLRRPRIPASAAACSRRCGRTRWTPGPR